MPFTSVHRGKGVRAGRPVCAPSRPSLTPASPPHASAHPTAPAPGPVRSCSPGVRPALTQPLLRWPLSQAYPHHPAPQSQSSLQLHSSLCIYYLSQQTGGFPSFHIYSSSISPAGRVPAPLSAHCGASAPGQSRLSGALSTRCEQMHPGPGEPGPPHTQRVPAEAAGSVGRVGIISRL